MTINYQLLIIRIIINYGFLNAKKRNSFPQTRVKHNLFSYNKLFRINFT